MKFLLIVVVAILGCQVLETTADVIGDYNLWKNQSETRLKISMNAYINSTIESVATFSNIFNKFVVDQTKNAELLIYYYYAYVNEARLRLMITKIKTRVDAGISALQSNFSSANITDSALYMYYDFFYITNFQMDLRAGIISRKLVRKPNATSCYESRKQSLFAVGTANLTNMENLMSESSIALKKRVTEIQTLMNTKSTTIINDLWYRLYYPRSYWFWTAEAAINAYVNTIEAPLLAEIDSRFEEIYLKISQVSDNVQTLTYQISGYVFDTALAITDDFTTCLNNY